MPGYVPLGYRPVKGVADPNGANPGNYTCVFDNSVINAKVSVFEMYHLYVTAPLITGGETTATVALNGGYWDVTLTGQANGWDPAQPMLMQPGDTMYVYWNVPTSNTTPPTVTAWFRFWST